MSESAEKHVDVATTLRRLLAERKEATTQTGFDEKWGSPAFAQTISDLQDRIPAGKTWADLGLSEAEDREVHAILGTRLP